MAFSLERWALGQDLFIVDPHRLREITDRYAAGDTLLIRSEFPISGPTPERIVVDNDEKKYDVLITLHARGREDAAWLTPYILTLGIGFNGGVRAENLELALKRLLTKGAYFGDAVRRIAVLQANLKLPGLVHFAEQLDLPVAGYDYEQMLTVKTGISYTGKRTKTNIHYICEAAAVLDAGGRVVVQKHANNGISMALAAPPYRLRFEADNGAEASLNTGP